MSEIMGTWWLDKLNPFIRLLTVQMAIHAVPGYKPSPDLASEPVDFRPQQFCRQLQTDDAKYCLKLCADRCYSNVCLDVFRVTGKMIDKSDISQCVVNMVITIANTVSNEVRCTGQDRSALLPCTPRCNYSDTSVKAFQKPMEMNLPSTVISASPNKSPPCLTLSPSKTFNETPNVTKSGISSDASKMYVIVDDSSTPMKAVLPNEPQKKMGLGNDEMMAEIRAMYSREVSEFGLRVTRIDGKLLCAVPDCGSKILNEKDWYNHVMRHLSGFDVFCCSRKFKCFDALEKHLTQFPEHIKSRYQFLLERRAALKSN